jgi:hypothetical protein
MSFVNAFTQGLDDYQQSDRYGAPKSLHAGIDASELKYALVFWRTGFMSNFLLNQFVEGRQRAFEKRA